MSAENAASACSSPAGTDMSNFATASACAGVIAVLVSAMAPPVVSAPPPPNVNKCKSKWVLSPLQQLDFGGFAVDAGSGIISMNSSAALTASGQISLSTSAPVTTFTASIDNSLGVTCASYGFTLSWNTPPAPLTGPGAAIPLANLRVSIPAYGLNDVTLPQTIAANPGNPLPFSMTLYGDITVSDPQTAGLYTSPPFIIDLTQSATATALSGTANATAFSPLGIVENVAMNFGTIAGGSIAGTVVLDTGGGRTPSTEVQVLTSGPGNAATFQVSGEPGKVYSLFFGDGILANAGGQQLGLTTFTHTASGTIPGSGVETFQVGGTLSIGANQPAGTYSTANGGGSPYTITVNYN